MRKKEFNNKAQSDYLKIESLLKVMAMWKYWWRNTNFKPGCNNKNIK